MCKINFEDGLANTVFDNYLFIRLTYFVVLQMQDSFGDHSAFNNEPERICSYIGIDNLLIY
jgi:hypothetical protein